MKIKLRDMEVDKTFKCDRASATVVLSKAVGDNYENFDTYSRVYYDGMIFDVFFPQDEFECYKVKRII